MTLRTLIWRSLRFHWRSHLGVVLGAAIGSAALIGALVVGDSVRASLRARALERLGHIRFVLAGKDRTFTDTLGERMPRDLMDDWRENSTGGKGTDTWVWFGGGPGAVLLLPGTAARAGGEARANHVTALGVWQLPMDDRHNHYYEFWNYAGWFDAPVIAPGEVWLNQALAWQLAAAIGDTVVLRLSKPSSLSADAPISPRGDSAVALRLRVGRIVEPDRLGDFSLYAAPTPPLNAFVNLRELQAALDLPGRANLLVTGGVEQERDGGLLDSLRVKLHAAGGPIWTWLADRLPRPQETERPAARAILDFQEELAGQVTLADYEASLRMTPGSNGVELISRRIFLDPPLVRVASGPATNAEPSAPTERLDARGVPKLVLPPPANGQPLLTYLVNLLRAGTNATPYSMVTAAGAPWTPPDLSDDEIVVTQWLADDLRVKVGDEVQMVYFLPESGDALREATNTFHVRGVVPATLPWSDRTLMPEFPGIDKAESTADWDTAFPLVHKIRPQDEAYWKQFRGTPKAFVTLAAGQKLWGNRFGNLTAIRFPVTTNVTASLAAPKDTLSAAPSGAEGAEATNTVANYRAALEATLLNSLRPEAFGLRFEPVREQALRAAEQSQDFGGLFLGFSFFLIAAALLLMALLFQFGVEQRVTEIGTLLALGFAPKQVRRLWLGEGAALAFVGGVLGALGGLAYARVMLLGLTTVWRDATGATTLQFHVSAATLVIGLFASTAVAVAVIWLTLRNLAKRPARELLEGEVKSEVRSPKSEGSPKSEIRKTSWRSLLHWFPPWRWLALMAGVGLVGAALAKGDTADAETFFSAGALVLIAGLGFVSARLKSGAGVSPAALATEQTGRRDAGPTLASLALRGLARRRSRSVAAVALLACGSFLIASIGVFRLDANRDATRPDSGTGGFALIGEATLPVVQDLNTPAGRDFLGLSEQQLVGVHFVQCRVRAGDEASCLNLNHAQQPRLLGVKPESLAGRFTFAKGAGWAALAATGTNDSTTLHSALRTPHSPDEIPAIGDAASIQWAMGKSVGDTIDHVDERGRPFKVRLVGALANSILQGSLVIDEAEFVKRFPSESGDKFFLLDVATPTNLVTQILFENRFYDQAEFERLFPGRSGYRLFPGKPDSQTNRISQVSTILTRALQDYGLELTPATRRLAQFNAVQNTYLGTFQVLGGLGLLLGSLGLGVVVLRNVLERRGELALLLAVGWRRRAIVRLVLVEHAVLLALGLGLGVAAAAVAVLPALLSPGAQLPWATLLPTLAGVLAVGAAATWLAARWALRGNLLAALRNE